MISATPDNKQFKIFDTACKLFLDKNFTDTSIGEIAAHAVMQVDEVYKYFGNKEDIILYLYKCVNADWEIAVAALPHAKLHTRFNAAIAAKLHIIAPYKTLLRNIFPHLLNTSDIGIFSRQNALIRKQGMAVIQNLIANSKGGIKGKRSQEMAKMLYMMHWLILFIAIHEDGNKKATKLLDLLTGWLKDMNLAKQIALPYFLPKLNALTDILLEGEELENTQAKDILTIILNKRKTIPDSECEHKFCEKCYTLHIPKLQNYIDQELPIHIILPAFPAKSPNRSKVLGHLPDLGEEIALLSLQTLCDDIQRIYKPGARITICADGRIFADLVQVTDQDVTLYTEALKQMIQEANIECIDVYNIEDLLQGKSIDDARQHVIDTYSESLSSLKDKVKNVPQYTSMFNGIHRFISEDRMYTEPEKSKSKIKDEAKEIALRVIQRSNAWTRFLSYYYPDALRLSIHPQHPHSEKIGIRLTRAVDEWITPWHGVIVLNNNHYTLMKKTDAEKEQATLMYKDGIPNHYKM